MTRGSLLRATVLLTAAAVLAGCRFHPADSRHREPPMDAAMGAGDEFGQLLHARSLALAAEPAAGDRLAGADPARDPAHDDLVAP